MPAVRFRVIVVRFDLAGRCLETFVTHSADIVVPVRVSVRLPMFSVVGFLDVLGVGFHIPSRMAPGIRERGGHCLFFRMPRLAHLTDVLRDRLLRVARLQWHPGQQ